jgi:ribonuclease D
MRFIADSGELAEFAAAARASDFVTVDTEFMRERTYWPHLCLVQLATAEEAVVGGAGAPGGGRGPRGSTFRRFCR